MALPDLAQKAWARLTLAQANSAALEARPVEQAEAWARKTLVQTNSAARVGRLVEQAEAWARKTLAQTNSANLEVRLAAHQPLEINWDNLTLELKAWAAPEAGAALAEAAARASQAT